MSVKVHAPGVEYKVSLVIICKLFKYENCVASDIGSKVVVDLAKAVKDKNSIW